MATLESGHDRNQDTVGSRTLGRGDQGSRRTGEVRTSELGSAPAAGLST